MKHLQVNMGTFGDLQVSMGKRTAEVAPDGHSIVFMAFEGLTGYDNEIDGHRLGEVYVYDNEDSRLTCASCNPSGEVPQTSQIGRSRFRWVFATKLERDLCPTVDVE